jgi:hypothetical protein
MQIGCRVFERVPDIGEHRGDAHSMSRTCGGANRRFKRPMLLAEVSFLSVLIEEFG